MNLPKNWHPAKLGDVAEFVMGQAPKKEDCNYDGIGTPFVKAGEFGEERPIIREWTTTPLKEACESDVLICVVGATSGKLNLGADCAIGRSVAAVRPASGMDQMYVYRYLQTLVQVFRKGSTGSAQGVISKDALADTPLPLCSSEHQRRIADKIDALQAKSRSTREALEAVGPLLEKFRQSVLAAAFRGDLTAEWRKQHPDVEPAEKLLERIRTERRARWEEAELAKMRAKGIKPKDDKWKANYTEPAYSDGPETQHVSSFVDTKQLGWSDCPLLSVCDDHRGIPYGIVQTGDPVDGGVPTVRCGDIKRFSVDLAGLKLVDPNISAGYERTLLTGGEVLIAIRGSVGEATVATADMAGMNISREVAMIPVLSGINPRYVMYLLSSPVGQRLLMDKVKGVAQQGINLADLRQFPVPLPCADEQQAIVDLLDGAMARIDAIQAQVEGSKADSYRHDQSILAKAFRGELVPQDPNDEPASVLLERIKAEREARQCRTKKPKVK